MKLLRSFYTIYAKDDHIGIFYLDKYRYIYLSRKKPFRDGCTTYHFSGFKGYRLYCNHESLEKYKHEIMYNLPLHNK